MEVTMSGNHDLSVGDVVKVITTRKNGFFKILFSYIFRRKIQRTITEEYTINNVTTCTASYDTENNDDNHKKHAANKVRKNNKPYYRVNERY